MDLYFLNKDRELVGIIDTAKSVQWLERYFGVGTFEVYVQVNDDVLEIVNQSYFVARNDSTYVGIIEHIENEDDIDNGNYLIIQGRMAESLIGRRIIRNITYLNASLVEVCNQLLQANILDPVLQVGETVSPRKMSCLNIAIRNQLITNPSVQVQATFEDNLYEYIQDLLKSYNKSIRLELTDSGTFDVVLYEGTDRSYNQSENPYVVFAKGFDNLITSTYMFDSTQETNALYVGGEDNETAPEGRYVDKYEYPVGGSVVSDIDRIEAFVNASDIKQNWEEELADGTKKEYSLTATAYRNLLKTRGQENVVIPSEELTASVDMTTYIYNQDYFLGDIVTIENETLGAYVNKRLIGMDIVDDENGRTLSPIFDEVKEISVESGVAVAALLTENEEILTTEYGEVLAVEETPVATYSKTATASETYSIGSVKISELPEVDTTLINEECCMPIVSNGSTQRITYENLKEKLKEDIGGVASYNDLTDKPQINSVELVGNKTHSDIGISPLDDIELEAILD